MPEVAAPHPVPIRPGLTGGACPERPPDPEDWLHTALHALAGLARAIVPDRAGRCPLGAIHQCGRGLAPLNDQALAEQTRLLRLDLHRRGLTDDLLIRALALVSETAGRTLGLRPYDTQLSGGWVLAHGRLAEMATGEGKTLTATLAAGAAALAGLPVHVITVNDYLVRRDAETTGPLYRGLGLSVAAVTADEDPETRRQGYRADVVYCTNKQLAFDYLRDRLVLGNDQGRLRLQLEPLHSGDRTARLFLACALPSSTRRTACSSTGRARRSFSPARCTARRRSSSSARPWTGPGTSPQAPTLSSTGRTAGCGSAMAAATAWPCWPTAPADCGEAPAAARNWSSRRSRPCTSMSATATTWCRAAGC
jgi:hypothetical protein